MRIKLKNNIDKFHPDQIWNDGALGVWIWKGSPDRNNKNNNNNHKISSDLWSAPGPKNRIRLSQ